MASDDKLRKLVVATKQVTLLDTSRYGGFSMPVWSPDGKWIAYRNPISRTTDVYLVAASGEDKEPHRVTFDSSNEGNPRFGPDGRKLFFARVEAVAGNAPTSRQIFSGLKSRIKIPDDPRSATQNHRPRRQKAARVQRQAARRGPPANRPPRNQNRSGLGATHTSSDAHAFPNPQFLVAPDSRTIVFVTTEPAGTASVPVIYSIQDDGRRLTRVTSDNATKAAKVVQVVAAVLVAEFPISRSRAMAALSFSVSVMAFIRCH